MTVAPLREEFGRMPRPDRARLVAALAERGLAQTRIAAMLGVRKQTVNDLIRDPDGARQRERRRRYQRPCPSCGRMMDGSGGFAVSPTICAACANTAGAHKRWTRGRCIAAAWLWAADHDGQQPAAADWQRHGRTHPSYSAVYGKSGAFAAWADLLEAAGWPRPSTGRRIRPRPAGAVVQGKLPARIVRLLVADGPLHVAELRTQLDEPRLMRALGRLVDAGLATRVDPVTFDATDTARALHAKP